MRCTEKITLLCSVYMRRPVVALTKTQMHPNAEDTLRKTIKEHIQNNHDIYTEVPVNIDSIKFAQVKRIGDPVKAAQSFRPRPIVATLTENV